MRIEYFATQGVNELPTRWTYNFGQIERVKYSPAQRNAAFATINLQSVSKLQQANSSDSGDHPSHLHHTHHNVTKYSFKISFQIVSYSYYCYCLMLQNGQSSIKIWMHLTAWKIWMQKNVKHRIAIFACLQRSLCKKDMIYMHYLSSYFLNAYFMT